jgi:hypothetical protein
VVRRDEARYPPRGYPLDLVVEDATGRKVIGFMSGNQQDPDMICEVFVLAQNSLLDDP